MHIDRQWVGALDESFYDDMNPYTRGDFRQGPGGKEVDGKKEAIAVANGTSWGLTAGVSSPIRQRGPTSPNASNRAKSTWTTRRVHDEPQAPFGGVKDSGWDRFGGKTALEEFTKLAG